MSIHLSPRTPVFPAPLSSRAPESLFEKLSALYALTQRSPHVFASPLGPFRHEGQTTHLPRFVFFGPHASEESWRVAFLAGFDRRDLRSSHALVGLVDHLAAEVEDGFGLNLTFFPVVDAAGFFLDAAPRTLTTDHWSQSDAPEIDLLEKDARTNGYHGFVRVQSAEPGDEIISLRVRAPLGLRPSPDVEIISTADTDPYVVRFEMGSPNIAPGCGPLSVADDLPVSPFELTLRIPATWSDARYEHAVRTILSRFILRYRAFQAYGQHL